MNQKLYETVFIARQDLSTAQVETLANLFATNLKNNGAEVQKIEFCGLKLLAYPIRKNRKGHYILFQLEAPAAAIQEMERTMRLNEDVLRYLTICVPEHATGPCALTQNRAWDERPPRPETDELDEFVLEPSFEDKPSYGEKAVPQEIQE